MQISKSQLKSQLLAILREIESQDTEVIITDRGKPVAIISKYHASPTTEELFSDLRRQIQYYEEPTVSTLEEWGGEV